MRIIFLLLALLLVFAVACEGPPGPTGPAGMPGSTDGLVLIQSGTVHKEMYTRDLETYWVKFYLPGFAEGGIFYLRLYVPSIPEGVWWNVDGYRVRGHDLLVSDGNIYLLEKKYELWGLLISLPDTTGQDGTAVG